MGFGLGDQDADDHLEIAVESEQHGGTVLSSHGFPA